MRRIVGTIVAGGVWLGLTAAAAAQDSVNAFGSYPTALPTGAPYTAGLPAASYVSPPGYVYRPQGYVGSGYAPGAYSSYYGAPAYRYRSYSYPAYRYRRGLFGWRNRAW